MGRDPEENRRVLLEHAASHLRNWTTTVLAITVAIFATFSAEAIRWLGSRILLDLVLAFLLSQMLLSFGRIIWYDLLFREVLCAIPRPCNDPRTRLRKGEEETELFLLHAGAEDLVKSRFIHPRLGEIMFKAGTPLGWVVCSVILTTVTLAIFWLSGRLAIDC